MNIAEIKAYQEKIGAQLQEAKAVLNGFEAHAKGKLAQSEIDTITRLKAKNQEIEKKVHHDLKTAGEVAVAAKIKSDVDAEMTKFKSSLDQLSAKIKNQSPAQ
jgi:ribosomal protein L9